MSYIDSRGVEMEDLSFSEALERVHLLAYKGLPDEHDIARDATLADYRDWCVEALTVLHDLIVNHHENIDDAFSPPEAAGDWGQEVLEADRSDDPSAPLVAIKIALQIANAAMPDAMAINGVVEADEYDRDAQAIDLVSDLVAIHGAALSASITLYKIPDSP